MDAHVSGRTKSVPFLLNRLHCEDDRSYIIKMMVLEAQPIHTETPLKSSWFIVQEVPNKAELLPSGNVSLILYISYILFPLGNKAVLKFTIKFQYHSF